MVLSRHDADLKCEGTSALLEHYKEMPDGRCGGVDDERSNEVPNGQYSESWRSVDSEQGATPFGR